MSVPDWTPLPPQEAIDYFRRKGYALTWDWRDVAPEVHAHALTVAKMTRADLLADVRAALDRAIAEGRTLADFRRELEPRLQAAGWWGRREAPDPVTGERRTVQLGSPRRLATIFDTNVRTAYAAGRWQQIQRTVARRPYLRYVAILDTATRPQHRAWAGLVLRADDPWWETHFPPNGWRCRCTVQQLGPRDLERYGYQVGNAPPVVTQPWTNPRTGEVRRVPIGLDPGFDQHVGRSATRALTPAALDAPGLPRPAGRPPSPASAAPLPAPRAFPAAELLADGLPAEEYAAAFLDAFRADARPAAGGGLWWQDATGEPLRLGPELFQRPDGAWKIRRGRGPLVRLLAATLRAPDEVWASLEPLRASDPTRGAAAGSVLRYVLRRRYVARWVIAGRDGAPDVPGYVVFEWGADGWNGVTTFVGDQPTGPQRDAYLQDQRRGVLLYRRVLPEPAG